MKNKYILQKNRIILLIALIIAFVMDISAVLFVELVIGLEGMDELDLFEYYVVLAFLPLSFVASFIFVFGSERLKVNDNTVAKYKGVKKVQEINWTDVVSVERNVVRNGISKTEKPTMTEIFVVLKLIDNTEMSFMYSNKGYGILKAYFDNTRQTDKF